MAVCLASTAVADTIYVEPTASQGADNGTSWRNAFLSLHHALAAAEPGDEVRVATATYRPALPNGDRAISFRIPEGVMVQGGFAGLAGADPDLYEPSMFPTILDGDLNGDDGSNAFEDNTYHVVRVITDDMTVPNTTLKGITVRGGNADLVRFGGVDQFGGGVLLTGALALEECTIEHNRTSTAASSGGSGGGVYGGLVHMLRCTVRDNRSWVGAGVVASAGSVFSQTYFFNNDVPLGGIIGGLECDQAVIDGCVFEGCYGGDHSGAIKGNGYVITDSSFIHNSAYDQAGAINGSGRLIRCDFFQNSSLEGGAVRGNVVAHDCDFIHNGAGHWGGAIRGSGTFSRCRFVRNFTNLNNGFDGGAVSGSGQFHHCVFIGNSAGESGGAIAGANAVINCYFSGNQADHFGGAIRSFGTLLSVNSTFLGNRSSRIEAIPTSAAVHGVNVVAVNCIFRENVSDEQDLATESSQLYASGSLQVSHSLIHGWTGALGGVGNSGDDPLLLDPRGTDGIYGTEDDDPRLAYNSPARDAGDTTALPPDQFDLDGDGDVTEPIPLDLLDMPRVHGPVVDIGAVELQSCLGDLNGDGQIGMDDLLRVLLNWGRCTAPPIECVGNLVTVGASANQVDVDDMLAVIARWGACTSGR